MRRAPRPALLVALLLVAAACGDGDKAGGPAEPVELTMTNNDSGSGVLTTPAAGRFVELVEELSAGQLVVNVEVGPFATDGQEIRDVAAARADLGWTGTRVFDLLGVDEFSPLHAPFLIDSYELQAAVLDSEIPGSMLPSLARLDVEPLAIFADGLRFPAAARSPMLAAADWRDAGIWLLESEVQAEGVEALGGTVINSGDPREMLYDGTAKAIEDMWIYYSLGADYLYAPYVTPNVVLSPRTTALFGNPAALAALTDEQRRWIDEAAADAASWSSQHADDDDVTYMQDACDAGARIALASAADLADLRAAVAPVYDRLRDQDATAESMAAIETLRSNVGEPEPLAVPADCSYRPGEEDVAAPEPLIGPGPTGDFPLGTYRFEVGDDEVPEVVEGRGTGPGVYTWTMGDGRWTVATRPSTADATPVECQGWYRVDGAVVTFTTDRDVGGSVEHCLAPVWTVRWAVRGETVIWGIPSVLALAALFALHPWERIG